MQELMRFLKELKDAGLLDLNFVRACLCNHRDVSNEIVAWKSVKLFLNMAEQALIAKNIQAELAHEREQEAKEEALFLNKQLETLQEERDKTHQRLQQLERENNNLLIEASILRDQAANSPSLSATESPGASQLVQKYRKELSLEQARNEMLESELRKIKFSSRPIRMKSFDFDCDGEKEADHIPSVRGGY